jgi:hypothetical protein
MKVTVNNQEYWIDFEYQEKNNNLLTSCNITNSDLTPIAGGFAKKAIKDSHVKETGRKIALANAINGFDKATRTAFWNQYFSRKSYRTSFSYAEVKKMFEKLEDCHSVGELAEVLQSLKVFYNIRTEE